MSDSKQHLLLALARKVSLFLLRRIERFIHNSWATFCSKFGPELKITKASPLLVSRTTLRYESYSRWTRPQGPLSVSSADNQLTVQHPAVTVCHLKDIAIVGRESFIFTDDHELLRLDISMDDCEVRKIRRPIDLISRQAREPVLSLGSRHTDNHYHFLFEHLPLVLLAREYLGKAVPLTILVTPGQSWWQTEYLVKIGEDPDRIMELGGTIKATDAWVIPNLALADRACPYEIELYREIARRFQRGITLGTRNRKLFITRKDAPRRQLINEDQIFDFIREIYPDVEIVDLSRISLQSQIELFTHATFVIGAVGQAFRNILFCNKALCVELIPGRDLPTNIYAGWYPATLHLSKVHDNRYVALYAEEDYNEDQSNWIFPLAKLKEKLNEFNISL